MAFGISSETVDLDGSGDGTGSIEVNGVISSLRVERSGGSPTVTINDRVDDFLDAVVVSADTTYHPSIELSDVNGVASSTLVREVAAGRLNITVTGGAASGTVTILVKIL